MLKKYSVVNFVLLIIIALLGILLSVCPFNVPTTTDRYNGFLGAVQKGLDISGGVSAIYSTELKNNNSSYDLTETIDNALSKVENVFSNNGTSTGEAFPELYVSRQGDKIRIEASGVQTTDSVFDYLADGEEIFITLTEVSDTVTEPTVYLNSNDIDYAYVGYDYDNSNYTVVLEFTNSGKIRLENMLTDADEIGESNVYIYIEQVAEDNLLSDSISIDDIDTNITFAINSSSDYYSPNLASGSVSATNGTSQARLSYIITGGALGLNLSYPEKSEISAVLGQNTLLYLGIASLLTIVLTLILLIIKYKDLGLLGALSTIFYLILFVFFMQAIPFVILNLATMFGCLFAFFMSIIANVVIFENIKSEYSIGKKIHLSFKGGQKKSLWTILDSHVVIALVAIVIWIFAPSYLKGFGIMMLLGSILSVFISLVVTRYLLNIYLPLNSTKSKRLGLYREKDIKEIKDDNIALNSMPSENSIVENTQDKQAVVTENVEGGNIND